MYLLPEIKLLSDYRINCIKAFLSNTTQYRSLRNIMAGVEEDQIRVKTHLENYDEDLNTKWTEYFPRIYHNFFESDRAAFKKDIEGFISFDPENERIFKDLVTNQMYVVPKLDRDYISKEYDDGSRIPVFCNNPCKEIKFHVKK